MSHHTETIKSENHIADASKMVQIRFHVPGLPKGEPRTKACRRGAHAGVYRPGTSDDWRGLVATFARQHRPEQPIMGPVQVDIRFVFPRPKSHHRTGKNAHLLRDDAPGHHTSKPDRDNCEKLVLDTLTKLGFWGDDAQVCAGEVTKRYSNQGGMPAGAMITITPLDQFPRTQAI